MMKQLTSLALFLLICVVARGALWPEVEYAEVRGYAFNFEGGQTSIIVDGNLHSTVVNKDGALLTKAQVARLLAALTVEQPRHPIAACFNPRHAFVFYDKNKKPVATVDVCFECLGVSMKPEGPAFPHDLPALAELCAELKLKKAPDAGFRKWFENFRKQ